MRTLSVAVVGAGPAGTTAARLLASRGAKVSLFEAQHLPRPKTCGGGLSPKAQRLVPSDVLKTVEQRVHRVELRGGWLPAFHLDEPEAELAMVERGAFDFAMTEAAAAAGVEVRSPERVMAVTEDDDGVTITTRLGQLTVDAVVAADGEPSSVIRGTGLGGPAKRRSLAIEVDLPLGPAVPADTAVFALALPGGYAWYFPKGDHANIGAGSYEVMPRSRASVDALRRALGRFATEAGLDLSDGRIVGNWIPQGLRTGALASRRVVLAGDAAGAADPLFAEGISYAIISGVVAAQAIADWETGKLDDLRPFDARLRGLLGPPFGKLMRISLAAELSATLALATMRLSDRAREVAIDAIAGRRPPYAIDGHCESACTCGMGHQHSTSWVCAKACSGLMPIDPSAAVET